MSEQVARVTPQELRALLTVSLAEGTRQLTNIEVGKLTRYKIHVGTQRKGYANLTCQTASLWLNGHRPMPLLVYESLVLQLQWLKEGKVTLKQLLSGKSLAELDSLVRKRKK